MPTLRERTSKRGSVQGGEERHEVAEVHMAFMFMGDEGSEKTLATLVVRERSRGMTMATVAPRKYSGE